ncbi:hypothetical protein [Nisaea sp.]|uniref:hypothetical protein n=1 Tax=Nisaea sp. TaxID=2024842 RepID=UPI003299DC09
MFAEKSVTASEFAKKFGQFQHNALAGEIVTVTSYGRDVGAFVPPSLLEDYKRLKQQEREVLITGQLPDDILADIAAAEYDTAP